MEYRTLGRSGLRVSPLCLGTMMLGSWGNADEGECVRIVHRALEKLSQLNREIILLKEIQGLSLESIASICQAPLGTIKSRSSRARLELARVLADLMEEESEPGRGSRR